MDPPPEALPGTRGQAYVPVGDVQQVPQPAAPLVPSLVADAIFQDDVVSAKGPQEGVHILRGPLCIYLINLQNEINGGQGKIPLNCQEVSGGVSNAGTSHGA